MPRFVLMLRQPERDQKVAELEAPTAEGAVARFADRLYAVPVERAPKTTRDGVARKPPGRKRVAGTLVYRGVAYEREVAGSVTTYRRGERWARVVRHPGHAEYTTSGGDRMALSAVYAHVKAREYVCG